MALRIGLNITGVPEDVLPEAAQLDAASTDPGRRPASGACRAFPRDTDAARLHQPTDSSSRLPFISLLPPTRRRYRLPSRWRRHRQRHLGAGPPWQPKRRPTTRSIFDCDTTSARRVHHRDCRRSHLYPHCLPLDVSVQLGTLAKWEGAARPKELAVAALPRVDPPSMTPRRRTGRGPGPVTHVLRRLDAEGARALVEDCPNLKRGLSLLSRARRRQCSSGVVDKPVSRSAALAVVAVTVAAFLFGVARLARSRSSMSPRCSSRSAPCAGRLSAARASFSATFSRRPSLPT